MVVLVLTVALVVATPSTGPASGRSVRRVSEKRATSRLSCVLGVGIKVI